MKAKIKKIWNEFILANLNIKPENSYIQILYFFILVFCVMFIYKGFRLLPRNNEFETYVICFLVVISFLIFLFIATFKSEGYTTFTAFFLTLSAVTVAWPRISQTFLIVALAYFLIFTLVNLIFATFPNKKPSISKQNVRFRHIENEQK